MKSRDQIVSNYYLLALYMSGTYSNMSGGDSWTWARVDRGHRAPSSILGSLRVLGKGYLLEQGSTSILEHLGNSIALEHLGGSSRASIVVLLLEHAEHRSMLCSNMLVHNARTYSRWDKPIV